MNPSETSIAEYASSATDQRAGGSEPSILRVRRIELEVNDPDINMCGCHCISYCTCNCDRGGLVS